MAVPPGRMPAIGREQRQKPCPICGGSASAQVAPFCSMRCADVDLHRWLGGAYVVPTDEPAQAVEAAEDE